jgi:deazaflavin-dependent oxidoreductase (nitroreductase family)
MCDSSRMSRPGIRRALHIERPEVNQRTYTKCVRPAAFVMARAHVAVLRISGGRVGNRWRGGEIGVLSTVGRSSGRRRTIPLVCLRDGADVVVVASNGGSDRTPAWWLNLQSRPYAELELAGHAGPVIAEQATPEDNARLSRRFCETFPFFGHYRARTERVLPVIVLRPLS